MLIISEEKKGAGMDKIFRIFRAKAPLTIIGVLLIGIVCSAIYDAVVKPGFSIFSQVLFDLFTFGSQRAKDYTFSNAALDPSTLPSMLIMVVVVTAAILAFTIFNIEQYFSTQELLQDLEKDARTAKVDEIINAHGADPQKVHTEIASLYANITNAGGGKSPQPSTIKGIFRVLGFVSWSLLVVFLIGGWVLISATNQSLLVWRSFNANVNIITPYIKQSEVSILRAKFAQVRTEKDYLEVRAMLDSIAANNNVTLRNDVDN